MNNEAPARIWLSPVSFSDKTTQPLAYIYDEANHELQDIEYRRIDPPAAPDERDKALAQMDWQQVALNGGPPCFAVLTPGHYCGRAERWAGHGVDHAFVSLESLVATVCAEVWDAAIEIAKAEAFERRMAYCVVDALESARTGKNG